MLNALNLPVSEEQLRGVAKLEKEYLQNEIVPLLKQELDSFVDKMRSRFHLDMSYDKDSGLSISVEKYTEKQNTVNQGDSNSFRDTTRYSIDGGEPLNKRRFVLAVVKKYVESHPGVSFEDLKKRFPDRISGSPLHGIFKPLDDVLSKLEMQPDLEKRFFLDDDDLIELADGTIITVYNQWGAHFPGFLELAKQMHHVEAFGNNY